MTDEPFIPPPPDGVDVHDPAWVQACLAYAGHPHIQPLARKCKQLQDYDAILHLTGLGSGVLHDELLETLDKVRADSRRSLQAIYN